MIREAATAASLFGFAFAPALALATVPPEAADNADDVMSITGQGGDRWEMICHVLPASGEETVYVLNASRSRFSGKNIHSASCDFKNQSNAPLVISISAPGFKCPLKSSEPDQCVQTFPKYTPSSFALRNKRSR